MVRNRIEKLKYEEQKARKKIEETKKRASKILEYKTRNATRAQVRLRCRIVVHCRALVGVDDTGVRRSASSDSESWK